MPTTTTTTLMGFDTIEIDLVDIQKEHTLYPPKKYVTKRFAMILTDLKIHLVDSSEIMKEFEVSLKYLLLACTLRSWLKIGCHLPVTAAIAL